MSSNNRNQWFRNHLDPSNYGKIEFYKRQYNSNELRNKKQTRETERVINTNRNKGHEKRKIGKATTSSIMLRCSACIIGGALFIGGINSCINSKNKENKEYNENIGINIIEKLEKEANSSIIDEIEYDPETGEFFSNGRVTVMPELSKVLYSSKTDEVLNEYYNNHKKEELDLSPRQINDLSFDIFKALIADGMDTNIDDVKLTYVNTSTTATVNVQVGEEKLESYAGGGKSNNSQINKDLSSLIRTLCLYKNDSSNVSLNEALELYEDVKLIANKYEIQVCDGKLVLKDREDEEIYLYDSDGKHTKIETQKEIENDGR